MALGGSTGTGWYAVAPAAEVGTTPLPVAAGDRAYVVVRLQPGGEVSAFPARCPHRLVPLRTATVTDGRLQCPAHGGRCDSEGRCVDIPSLGATGTPPPRADLAMPWALEERHGWVWLAPDRTAAPSPARATTAPGAQRAPAAAPPPAAAYHGAGARAGSGADRAPGPGVRQSRPLAGARLAPGGAVARAAAGRMAAGPPAGTELDAAPGRGRALGRTARFRGARAPRRHLAGTGRTGGRAVGRPGGRRPPVRQQLALPVAVPRAGRTDGGHLPRRHPWSVRARVDHRPRGRRRHGRVPGRVRARRVHQRPGTVVRQPGGPRGRGREPGAAAAPADHLHLPRALPAAVAPGVPRLRGDDDDRVPPAARGPRLLPALRPPAALRRTRPEPSRTCDRSRADGPAAADPRGGHPLAGSPGAGGSPPRPARRAARPGRRARRGPAAGPLRLHRGGSAGDRRLNAQSGRSSVPHAGQVVGGSSSASRPQAGHTRRSQQAGSPPSSSGSRGSGASVMHPSYLRPG